MNDEPKSILIVDDEEEFLNILSLYFDDLDFTVFTASNGIQAFELFQAHHPDVLIFDIDMPGLSGIELLSKVHADDPDTPVIMISGMGSLTDVVNALRLGAWDYLSKPLKDIEMLGITVERALDKLELIRENREYRKTLETEIVKRTNDLENKKEELEIANVELKREIREKAGIEQELYDKNKFLELILSSIKNPIFVVDVPDMKINLANREAQTMFSAYYPDKLFEEVFSRDHVFVQVIQKALENGEPVTMETCFPDSSDSGEKNHYLVSAYPIPDSSGTMYQVIENIIDITPVKHAQEENKKLQEQFLQSQKMESVGRLAGGIAHDFNNMLTTIVGYGELILMDSKGDEFFVEDLKTVIDTGRKAAMLTQQLLAFSRKQVMEWKIVHLNTILTEMHKLLIRLLGEDVHLEYHLCENCKKVQADPTQIDQVIMNLCVNARDAMPRGGTLTITTEMVKSERIKRRDESEIIDREYVLLSVADSGDGIDPKIMENIFEPFFTTKEKNKGTGLGLATVFGIVKQHKGFIQVNSEVGRGTVFEVFFPVAKVDEIKSDVVKSIKPTHGEGTVLIVEDDEKIRRLLKSYLSRIGFDVLISESVNDALKINQTYEGSIDLILTDVIMPGMDGLTLSQEIRKHRNNIKVLLMSGYTDDRLNLEQYPELMNNFIRKPIDMTDLITRIKKLIK